MVKVGGIIINHQLKLHGVRGGHASKLPPHF
jgi:hypothetical protein